MDKERYLKKPELRMLSKRHGTDEEDDDQENEQFPTKRVRFGDKPDWIKSKKNFNAKQSQRNEKKNQAQATAQDHPKG